MSPGDGPAPTDPTGFTDRSAFTPRTVHALGVAVFGAWHLKRYALAVCPDGPRRAVVQAGDAATAAVLAAHADRPPVRARPDDAAPLSDPASLTVDGHPVRAGFTIIHEARPACFLQINRWRAGVDLVPTYLTAPLDHPDRWTPVPGGAIGCVWELPVIAHERDAWVRHVLAPPTARTCRPTSTTPLPIPRPAAVTPPEARATRWPSERRDRRRQGLPPAGGRPAAAHPVAADAVRGRPPGHRLGRARPGRRDVP
jgi:hypothetical protein